MLLSKRILRRIRKRLRLVVVQVLYRHTDILKYLIKRLTKVSKRYRSVVRIILLNQYMSVEALHFRNGKNTVASE